MSDTTSRPTEDQPLPQWSRADLELATRRGEHDRINEARRRGQLAELLTSPNPRPKSKSTSTTTR